MKLELKNIRLDGDTQPRVALNEETVQDYAEAVMNGAQFPPAVVFHDGSSYWLADGFHRYFAHKRAGEDAIEVEMMNGTLRDAKLYSIGANSKHGLRRTNEDKRRAVLILLNDPEWSEWSDMEIARRACVSNATVHRVKKSLQLDQKPERKFTKNGIEHTMDVSKLSEKRTEPEYKSDPMAEMATEFEAVLAENKKLRENATLEIANIPEAEKLDIHEQLENYRHQIKVLETELTAVKRSRDTLQNENAELKKQLLYWKKRFQSIETKAA
jgi:ParB-like chromosome segregation protein Spo0J